MKKIAILGYGITGVAVQKLLQAQGHDDIDIYDDKKTEYTPIRDFKDIYDIVVVSPGVPPDGITPSNAVSEIDLAYDWLPMDSCVIGITGTNGKSTVTHLTTQILNNAGLKAIACGNIGYPFSEAVLNAAEGTIFVLELSSFQLELTKKLRLTAASVTNLAPDHLDRYKSLDDYYSAKLRILDLIEPDGLLTAELNTNITNRALNATYGVRYVDNELKTLPKLEGKRLNFGRYFVDISEYRLFGHHNIINLVHALYLADRAAKFEGDKTDLIKGLTGMPHRAELVLEHNGVTWINDSKATNVDSTLVALKSCKYPTIVLLGGKDKRGDFTKLVKELTRCAAEVIIFGEAADTIYEQLHGKYEETNIHIMDMLCESVELAKNLAEHGTTVILSPACASFDEFKNFEDRGREFAKYVKEAVNA